MYLGFERHVVVQFFMFSQWKAVVILANMGCLQVECCNVNIKAVKGSCLCRQAVQHLWIEQDYVTGTQGNGKSVFWKAEVLDHFRSQLLW